MNRANAARHPKATMIAVYRQRNVTNVERVLSEVDQGATDIRLWALDEAAPSLARWTFSAGPGQKFALLNRLIEANPIEAGALLVAFDDDFHFSSGNVQALLNWVVRAGLDLAQPAHASGSHSSHRITVRRFLSLVRLTTFVEIGPLFVVSPRAYRATVPFPEDFGMGWGLDLAWSDLIHDGLRLGVIDATSIRHLGRPGVAYDDAEERERVKGMLSDRQLTTVREMQQTVAVWRPWQMEPPWLKRAKH